jgi:hypothetical protein
MGGTAWDGGHLIVSKAIPLKTLQPICFDLHDSGQNNKKMIHNHYLPMHRGHFLYNNAKL